MKIKPILAQNPYQIKGFNPPEPPQNLEELIDTLLESPHLKQRERSYVRTTKNTKLRSEKQLKKVEAIAAHSSHFLSEEGGVE